MDIFPRLDRQKLVKHGLAAPLPLKNLHHHSIMEAEEIRQASGPEQLPPAPDELENLTDFHGNVQNRSNFVIILPENNSRARHSFSITDCTNFTVLGPRNTLDIGRQQDFLTITNCQNFSVTNIDTFRGENFLTISSSANFTISKCKSQNGAGYAVTVHDSHHFSIQDCSIINSLGGILLVGHCDFGRIVECTCRNMRGLHNSFAGIHLCATSRKIRLEHVPYECHEAIALHLKSRRPQHIHIRDCLLSDCRAQGLYLEGAVNCLIEKNTLCRNNKEGICFDWGSCYNLFFANTLCANGERRNISTEEQEIDYITQYPLLEDGSSSMKLPAISLDNGCVNVLSKNRICGNFGGGIKMIRAGLFNRISDNIIVANALGTNRFVPAFYGISLLGMEAVNDEFPEERNNLLEFLPSVFNTVTGNTLQGHYKEIFFDRHCRKNDISHNSTGNPAGCLRHIPFFRRAAAALRRRLHRTI
jgi:parallel beta-helix repeat protein